MGVLIVGEEIVGLPPKVYVPVVVPLRTGAEIEGPEIVGLPPSVYVPVAVPLKVGAVIVGVLIAGLDIVGDPPSVYVPVAVPLKVGAVIVGVLIAGEVRVLFVKVSIPARVDSVPVVGSVTFVAPLVVNVKDEVYKFHPTINYLDQSLS